MSHQLLNTNNSRRPSVDFSCLNPLEPRTLNFRARRSSVSSSRPSSSSFSPSSFIHKDTIQPEFNNELQPELNLKTLTQSQQRYWRKSTSTSSVVREEDEMSATSSSVSNNDQATQQLMDEIQSLRSRAETAENELERLKARECYGGFDVF